MILVLKNYKEFELQLTCDDKSSLGCTQSGLSSQSMLGAALIALVSVLGAHVADVQLSRRQNQVFPV